MGGSVDVAAPDRKGSFDAPSPHRMWGRRGKHLDTRRPAFESGYPTTRPQVASDRTGERKLMVDGERTDAVGISSILAPGPHVHTRHLSAGRSRRSAQASSMHSSMTAESAATPPSWTGVETTPSLQLSGPGVRLERTGGVRRPGRATFRPAPCESSGSRLKPVRCRVRACRSLWRDGATACRMKVDRSRTKRQATR